MSAGSDPGSLVRPLHVVESWPPVTTGYTQRSAALVAAQDRRPDLAPRVLVSSRQLGYGEAEVASQVAGADLTGRVRAAAGSPRERRMRRLRRPAVDASALSRDIAGAVDALGADLLHVHWSSSIARAAAAVARARDLPLVAEVRFDLAGAVTAQTARVPAGPLRDRLERVLRRRFEAHLLAADGVVAASASLAAQLERVLPTLAGRVAVAANGVEPERFAPGPPDPALAAALGLTGRLVLGTTSTMLRYEGLDLLLEAAARLRGAYPTLSVLLVGDGPEFANLRQQASRLGVPLVLTGRVPPQDVAAHYRLLDVMVLPRRDLSVTRYAGPLKLVEALCTGRACVASAVGDIPTLLADDRGVLVPPGDLPALVDALDALLADPSRRAALGAAGSAWARTAATWDAAAAVHREVYDRVLA